MSIRILLTLIAVGGAGASGLYGGGAVLDAILGEPPAAAASAGPPEPTRVLLARPERQEVAETVQAVGSAQALQSVRLTPANAGRITEINFTTGERVEEGQLLVQLDDRAERAALTEARARYLAAERRLERAVQLSENRVTSEADLEQARADLLALEAQMEAAQTVYDDQSLEAPFAGTMGMTDLDIGQRIDAATEIATLDDISTIEVAFSLPETYYGRVREGLPATARTTAYPGREFAATVSEIDPRIDPATRAFVVRAEIDNSDRALVAGLFMDVSLQLGSRSSVTVPEQGIVSQGEANYVFVAEDGTASRREVRLGRRLGERVEILEGLDVEESVVVGGIQAVEDGDAISATDDPGAVAERQPVG